MRAIVLLCLCLSASTAVAGNDLERELTHVLERTPQSLMIAVVYNAKTYKNPQLPAAVGWARIIAVPVKRIGDMGRVVVDDLLKNHVVGAVLVVEDDGRVLSHPRTQTHLKGLAERYGFELFTTLPGLPADGAMVVQRTRSDAQK